VRELRRQFANALLVILTVAALVSASINFQQQRRFGQRIQHIVQMLHFLSCVHAGRHALMACMAAHAVQALAIRLDDAHTVGFGQFQQVARARVLALRIDIQLQHAVRVLAQARSDGMETVDDA
jgi:hypothetical protein